MPRAGTTPEDEPLEEYAALAVTFWALFLGFTIANRRRLPERLPASDLVRITLATYKMSRVITKDDVTSFVRAPVTEDPEGHRPKRDGMAHALGELVTCPYCIGLWIAAGLSAAHVVVPRETQFLASIFSAHAVADFLHAGFVRLRKS